MISHAIAKLKRVNTLLLALLGTAVLTEVVFWLYLAPPEDGIAFLETWVHIGVIVVLIVVVTLTFRPAIQELVQGHGAVVEREAQIRRILDTANEGYALISPDTRQYIDVNDALCAMLGYTRDEMLGKTPLDFCDPSSAKVFRAQSSTIADTDQRQYAVMMRHKDGHAVYTQYNASTLRSPDGSVAGAFAFVTNVSHLREAQEALVKAKERAEEATNLKDKVVSLIAHDLKNPLGAIRGFADLMLTDTDEPLTPRQKESVDYILGQANELLTLISQVLDISRLQTGKIAPNRVFFDGFYTVEDVIARLGPQASEKGVQVVNDIPPGLRTYADPVLMAQVLQNLLSNALKFSHKGTSVHFMGAQTDSNVTISVRDSGVGIPKAVQAKLFSMDEQTSTLGTSGESGTGFGLPLSRQIMVAHGGDLTVSSVEGEGATFSATLPAKAPTVLLIDDDDVFAEMAAVYLEDIGAIVNTAENGKVALDTLNDGLIPDLILCDLVMPEMDGVTFLTHLKNIERARDIPVIVVSGSEQAVLAEQALKIGAADFTSKPITPGEFLARIRRYIA